MDYRAKHIAIDIADLMRKSASRQIDNTRACMLASITAYEMLTDNNTYTLECVLRDIAKNGYAIEADRIMADLKEYIAWRNA